MKYYQNCKHLIGNTQDIVEYLINKAGRESVRTVANFVSGSVQILCQERVSILPMMPPIVGSWPITENKAFDVLLDAYAYTQCIPMASRGRSKTHELEAQAEKLGVKQGFDF